jgi:peptidyl-prolyl cis-trans isomerase D
MLDALRRGAVNWFAKVLLGLLVVSFAIWGIADVFRGFGLGSLARVGSTEIPVSEFQRSYSIALDNYAQQFGRRPTPEEARQLGLDRGVLAELVGAAAIDVHTKELGLGLSEQAIIAAIESDPALRGVDGRFSKQALENILRRSGLSERGFIALKRRDEVRQQLTEAMLATVAVPASLVGLVHQYREETRTAQHFTIDPAKTAKLAEPSEAQLKETYDRNQQQFKIPERRQLALLMLSMSELKKRATVSEEAIKSAYESDKGRYNVPEKRRIQQIAFKDRDSALAAAKAIAEGKSFLDAAKEAGASQSDIELGLKSKAELLDPKIAEAAFALALNKVSTPVEGRYSIVLVKVTEIIAGKERTFEEVKGEIRDALAGEHAREEIRKLYDQVEDNRAAGKPLKEIAELLEVPYVEVPATDRAGMTPEGKATLAIPDAQRVLTAAFEGQVGMENEPVELSDGGIAWVDVIAVTPERLRPLADVRDEVKRVWRELETGKALADLADRLVTRANGGEALAALAAEAGGKVETTPPFKRTGAQSGLPDLAVARAFTLARGAAASAETADKKSRIVLKVTDIGTPPPPTKEQAEKLSQELARQRQTEAISEYLAALEVRYGVSVNEAVFRRTIGGEEQQ